MTTNVKIETLKKDFLPQNGIFESIYIFATKSCPGRFMLNMGKQWEKI